MSSLQEPCIDWEEHKTTILDLYTTKDFSLNELIGHMEKNHSFYATKAQYEGQFKRWKIRKNLTTQEWGYINSQIEKRKYDEKESDVYLHGRLISQKRVKKEISRRFPPTFTKCNNTDSSSNPPEAISIRTPEPVHDFAISFHDLTQAHSPEMEQSLAGSFSPNMILEGGFALHDRGTCPAFVQTSFRQHILALPEDSTTDFRIAGNDTAFLKKWSPPRSTLAKNSNIILHNLPWFQFQETTEPIVTSNANILLDGNFPLPNQLLSLSPTFSPTSPYWDELTLLGDAAPNPWIEVNKTGFAPQSPSITNLGIQWDRLGLAEGTVSADERHNFLTDLFDLRGSNNVEYLSHIRSQMQIFSLERYDGELSVRFQRFFGDSNNYVLFHIFEFVIYLTSNNVLSTNQIDHISKWIVKQKHEGVLRSCLKMQMPTTRAFAEKVLESALRIGDAHLLQLISDSEVDKRLLSGVHGGRHLRKAAKKGNVKIVQILLENGADINVPVCKEYNSTALHAAVIGGYVELVQLLLKAGANPNVPAYSELDSDKETPLSEAIRKRHAELVGVLVGAGANINLCTVDEDDGMEWAERNTDDQLYQILCTASGKDILPMTFDGIFKAASLDSQALSDYLNEKGADVKSNAKDKLEAALQAAADPDYFGGVNRDAVMSLLEIGVDPNAEPTDIWFKPILSAAGENDLELVEILLNASADANTLHALDRAAGPRDNLGLLTLLLDEGADIQTYGGEALEQAASHHNLEAVQFLLASGADVNAPIRSKGYRTPLQAATSDVELVRILIKAGADVNAYKSYYTGRTALQAAAYHRNIESVRELLKAGANVNAVGNPSDGFTALQVAAKWGNIDIVQILLDAGADVNAPGARVRGYTALQAACDIGNIKLIQILIDAGADVNAGGKRQSATMLQSAIKQGSFVLVKLLLMAGANANSPPRGIGGRSPIQEAAEKGNISLLELLLEAGADVNAAAGVEYGRTALQSAASAEKPNMELIEVLLKAGADISAPAGFKGGLTSLQGAAIRGHINLALRFLEAGADVNAAPATIDGRTALDGAAEYGHLDMVQMLLNSGARSDPSNDKRFGRPIELAEKNGHFAVAKLLESS